MQDSAIPGTTFTRLQTWALTDKTLLPGRVAGESSGRQCCPCPTETKDHYVSELNNLVGNSPKVPGQVAHESQERQRCPYL